MQMQRGFLQVASCDITGILSAGSRRDGKAVIVIIINGSNWIVIWRMSVLSRGVIAEFFMTTLKM